MGRCLSCTQSSLVQLREKPPVALGDVLKDPSRQVVRFTVAICRAHGLRIVIFTDSHGGPEPIRAEGMRRNGARRAMGRLPLSRARAFVVCLSDPPGFVRTRDRTAVAGQDAVRLRDDRAADAPDARMTASSRASASPEVVQYKMIVAAYCNCTALFEPDNQGEDVDREGQKNEQK